MNGKKRILIYGAGAIGIFLGTKLAKRHEVELYGRKKLSNLGGALSINGVPTAIPHIKTNLELDNMYDLVFVTVKMYDLHDAIAEIKSAGVHCGAFIFIQNGLISHEQELELKSLGQILGVTVYGGYRLVEGNLKVQEDSNGWQTDLSDTGLKVSELLNESGITTKTNSDIERVRAEKTLFVSSAAPISVLKDKKIGDLLDDPVSKQTMSALLREGYDVLRDKLGNLTYEKVERDFLTTLESIRDHYPSLYQDVATGRATEIEYLNGLILKLATEHGLSAPTHQDVYDRVKIMIKESIDGREHRGMTEHPPKR